MARQDKANIDFYEVAWENRRKTMEKFIAEGDRDPYSVIEKFGRYIAKYLTDNEGREILITYPKNVTLFPTNKPVVKMRPFLGEYYPGPFYNDPIEFLLDFIDGKDFSAIVELGAGYGKNLITIYYRGGPRNIPYYGGEITASGIRSMEMLAALKPEMQLKPFYFDHKNPDLSFVKECDNVLVFTVHSIEQVTEIPRNYFQKIASFFKQVTGVHLEPFGFQIQQHYGKPDEIQAEFFRQKNWNFNFAEVFLGQCQRKEIKQIFMAKNVMGGEPENPTSIAIWEKSDL